MLLALVRVEDESPCLVLLGSGSPPVDRMICLEILQIPVHGKFVQKPQCGLHKTFGAYVLLYMIG